MSETTLLQRAAGLRLELKGRPLLGPLMGAVVLLGLALAGYLAFVEATGGTVACIGAEECHPTQVVFYSRLLWVPVSYLGVVAYAVAGLLLAAHARLRGQASFYALLVLVALSMVGAVFSGYLTYVQVFVIDAICPWCVASAVAMVALALLTLATTALEVRDSE